MTLHCKLRAGPGGRNESAGCGSLTHCGSERSPRPAPRPGSGRTLKPRHPRTRAPKSTEQTKLPAPLVGGGGRAGLGGVSRAGSRTDARAYSLFPPSGRERAHHLGASALEQLTFPSPPFPRAKPPPSRGSRQFSPAVQPDQGLVWKRPSLTSSGRQLPRTPATLSPETFHWNGSAAPTLGGLKGRGFYADTDNLFFTHELELPRDTDSMNTYFCAKNP